MLRRDGRREGAPLENRTVGVAHEALAVEVVLQGEALDVVVAQQNAVDAGQSHGEGERAAVDELDGEHAVRHGDCAAEDVLHPPVEVAQIARGNHHDIRCDGELPLVRADVDKHGLPFPSLWRGAISLTSE